MPNPVLTVRAGPRAAARIKSHGLAAADIEIVPGAAGGPKGLGIATLDRAIFGEWLPSAPVVRHLPSNSPRSSQGFFHTWSAGPADLIWGKKV